MRGRARPAPASTGPAARSCGERRRQQGRWCMLVVPRARALQLLHPPHDPLDERGVQLQAVLSLQRPDGQAVLRRHTLLSALDTSALPWVPRAVPKTCNMPGQPPPTGKGCPSAGGASAPRPPDRAPRLLRGPPHQTHHCRAASPPAAHRSGWALQQQQPPLASCERASQIAC